MARENASNLVELRVRACRASSTACYLGRAVMPLPKGQAGRGATDTDSSESYLWPPSGVL